jgi:TolA-binding protein
VIPKARFRLGVALAELKRWENAERVLARLAQQSPDFPNMAEAELTRGRCLAKQDQERAAQAAYERVIQLDQGLLAARARLGLGTMRYDAGDMEDALSEFLKVALLYAHDEEVANALYMAGQCLEQMGQTGSARGRYREILDDHPSTTFADAARERLDAL